MGLLSRLKKRKEEKLADELQLERELQEYIDVRDTTEIILGDHKKLVYNNNTGVIKLYGGDIGGHYANAHSPINIKLYPLSSHRELPNSILPYESRIDDD